MAAPGFSFRLLGFGVRIDPWFVAVAALLGWTAEATWGRIAVWVGVVLVSVLVHELGHALAARARGASPIAIDLYAFGGLTRFTPAGPMGRLESAAVSLAGPGAGMVLGGVAAAAVAVFGYPDAALGEYALRVTVWVNIGWGLVNLLPVLPLDGGHVLMSVLPGDAAQRHVRAAWASVLLGGAAAGVLWTVGLFFGALLFVMFAASNLATARHAPRSNREAVVYDRGVVALERLAAGDRAAVAELERVVHDASEPSTRNGFAAALVEHLAMNGEPARARSELERLSAQVPPALYALVTVCETGGARGLDELAEVFVRQGDAASARYLVFGYVRSGRAAEIPGLFRTAVPEARSEATLQAALRAATAVGAHAVHHELGSLA